MPALSDRARTAVRALFVDRFGLDPRFFDSLRWIETNDEVWVVSAPPPDGVAHPRPPGLRAARLHPAGIKPTSHFLTLLGQRISRSQASVTLPQLRQILLGQRIAWMDDQIADGFVAIRYSDDVFGCGVLRHGRLHTLIPTGRRHELLNILDNTCINRTDL